MRRLATSFALLTAVLTLSVAGAAPALATTGHTRQSQAPDPHSAGASYYLALGDSLSVGIQPNAHGTDTLTRQGYTYQLARTLRQTDPRLRLVDLGCSGETTATMINGGLCDYPPQAETNASGLPTPHPAGSQLQAATRFLREHRGHVSLVTIDIGANDLNSCVVLPTATKITKCIEQVLPAVQSNLTQIMAALREAGGNRAPIVSMTYYDPELAYWLVGRQDIARASVPLLEAYNSMLAGVFSSVGARVAHVFTAFDTTDFTGDPPVTLPGIGAVPDNVAHICKLTWECTRFHNEHANAAGYQVIADAFYAAYREPPKP